MPKWSEQDVDELVSGGLPDGLAHVRVTSQEETESKNGKFAIKVLTRVKNFTQNGTAAPQYKGMPFSFTFYIGTDSDLGAERKETWAASFAAKRYKSYLKAASIRAVGDTGEECEMATGAELLVQVKNKTDQYEGKDVTRSEAVQFMPIGGETSSEDSRPNGLDKTVKRVAPVVAAKKVAAVEEYVEDDE